MPTYMHTCRPPHPTLFRAHRDSEPVKMWVQIQKKTFTKWVNSHLGNRTKHISDLTSDLQDGVCLIVLLEALTGRNIGVR